MRGRAMLISVLALATLISPVPGKNAAGATTAPATMAGIPDSRTLRAPVLATGQLLDAGGAPISGVVAAYAWPTNMPMQVGDVVHLTPAAWTQVGSDGAFALRSPGSPTLARLAGANGGYVNLSLEADSSSRHQQAHLSRYFGRGAGTLTTAEAWRERPELPASPVTLRFDSGSFRPTSDEARPLHPCWAEYELVKTEKAATVVGELNPEEDTISASFTYGEGNTADSDISIGVTSPGGGWASGGSFHLANSDQGRTVRRAVAMERLRISNNFDYHLYRAKCGNNERVIPHGWRGGVSSVAHLIPDCANTAHDDRYEEHSEFHRDRNQAGTWEGAVRVFGASLAARSGYSQQVLVHMVFGERPVHHVCGDNADAMHSNRVWTGINVEGPPCQPGRPC